MIGTTPASSPKPKIITINGAAEADPDDVDELLDVEVDVTLAVADGVAVADPVGVTVDVADPVALVDAVPEIVAVAVTVALAESAAVGD